ADKNPAKRRLKNLFGFKATTDLNGKFIPVDWKKELGAYFHFTRRDRIAILVILVLIFAVWALPRVMVSGNGQPAWVGDTSWVAEVRKMEVQEPGTESTSEERDPAGYFERPSYTG